MQAALAPNSSVPAFVRKRASDAEPFGAAIALLTDDGKALFLKRAGEGDHVGKWCFPGGGVEDGESARDAAAREAREETGWSAEDGEPRAPVTIDGFTTFEQLVGKEFDAKLDGEHTEFAWAPLSSPPEPLHPGVRAYLKQRGASAADMALDRAPRLMAIDRGSVRRTDVDGRLHVALTNISKADVNPYLGDEIPGWEEFGLEPKKIYQLYRDPEELARAAATSNGVPLLEVHEPMGAEDHDREKVVGAVGTDAVFNAPYLQNSLVVWDKEAIDDVESERKKELSCGYRYRADMTPGQIGGKRFDGVMRDIVFNHVALVEDGRAGPEVVVGDSKERLMASQKPTRIAAAALRITAAYLKPVMAADAKLDIGKLFEGLTSKNFKEKKPGIIAGLKKLKLAKDASMENVAHMLDTLEHVTEGADEAATEEEQKKAEEAAKGGDNELGIPEPAKPAADEGEEGLKSFLKEKGMGEDDIKAVCDMFGKRGAKDESPEEKKAREEKEAGDKKARDEAVAEEKKKGEDAMKGMVSKDEMNKAIKVAGDAATATQKAIRKAEADVRPYVGELSAMTFDSAAEVYRHTLALLKVPNAKDLPDAALETVLKMVPKPGAREEPDDLIALDAATVDRVSKFFPGIDKIGQV